MNPALIFNPPVIAHRGASASAPENTLVSLMLAREQKAPWVEFDVKITSDGVPILMHDDTLERTTSGHGKVADKDWPEIKALDAGNWFASRFKGERVPLLSEALRMVRDAGLRLNLEIKPCSGRDKATTMVTLIETTKWWPQDDLPPLLSSFSEEALASAMQLQPHWPRSLVFEKWQGGWREAAARIEAQALSVDEELLDSDNLRTLKHLGLPVLAYTVDDPARARDLLANGVTAVFSNDPAAMLRAL